ncbi:MAG: hypothetical protein IKH05_02975 [Bacteroidaceae bacterium]|nr:hypothetical protein [Bacteroidaceae bacterium]
MNTNRRNISILGAVLVFICLFSSCVRDKVRNSILMDSASDSILMDSASDSILMDSASDSIVMDSASDSIVMDSASDSIVMDSASDYIVVDLEGGVIDYVRNELFVNCTNDTLFICPSHCNDIDSIYDRAFPLYSQSRCMNDYVLLEVNGLYIHNNEAILPDSTCRTDYYLLSDTCYFFLIKWSDAKRCTWDEIREQKRYRTWVVTRDKDGNYDMNIRYLDSDL